MKYVLSCALLFLATVVFAQQQGQPPPTTTLPYQTLPTLSEGRQRPREQMPPDTKAPPPQAMSSERVEQQILDQLNEEPTLSVANIDARVDDDSVVLTGTVDTMAQHDLAVRIAQAKAGDRRIVDKITIRQQT